MTASAAYRAGEKIHDERQGVTFDYRRRSGVMHTEIMAPDNAPEWMLDRAQLWNAVEKMEKRKDSQLARDIELSLPHELAHAQRVELVREFVAVEFVDQGMIVDIAIHAPSKRGDQRNYHAHLLLTMRDLMGDGFGNKERAWNKPELCEHWREAWENHANRALEKAGFDARIDHRSLAAQGIDREAQIHQGPAVAEMTARGIETERSETATVIDFRNAERERLKAELAQRALEIAALEKEQADLAQSARIAEPPLATAAARLLALLHVAACQPDVLSKITGEEHGTNTRKIVEEFIALCHDPLHNLPRWLDTQGPMRAGEDSLLAQPRAGMAGNGELRPVRDERDPGRASLGVTAAAKDEFRMDEERPITPPDSTPTPTAQEFTAKIDDQTTREQAERQVDLLVEMEQQAKQAEVVLRQAALLDQMERQEQARRAFLEEQAALAAPPRDQQAQREPEDAGRSRNGDITDARNRYAQALGDEYSIRDPYNSLARAAMNEYGRFMKQQEALTKQIAEAKTPEDRRSLELRKEIEGCEYMVITSNRLAKMGRVIVGDMKSEQASRDETTAKFYQERASELRAERAEIEREKERTGRTQTEPPRENAASPRRQEATAGQAASVAQDAKTDAPSASSVSVVVPISAKVAAQVAQEAKQEAPTAAPAPDSTAQKPSFWSAARARVAGIYDELKGETAVPTTKSDQPVSTPTRPTQVPSWWRSGRSPTSVSPEPPPTPQQPVQPTGPKASARSPLGPRTGKPGSLIERGEQFAAEQKKVLQREGGERPGGGDRSGSGGAGGRGGGGASR